MSVGPACPPEGGEKILRGGVLSVVGCCCWLFVYSVARARLFRNPGEMGSKSSDCLLFPGPGENNKV